MSDVTKPDTVAVPPEKAAPAVTEKAAPAVKATATKPAARATARSTASKAAPKAAAAAATKPTAAAAPAPAPEPAAPAPAVEPTVAEVAPASAPAAASTIEMVPVEVLSQEAVKVVEDVVVASAKAVEAGQQAAETVARAGVDVVSETYGKAVILSQEQVDILEKAAGGLDDGAAFVKGNLEAAGASMAILIKGGQDMTILSFDYMKDLAEDSAKLGRDLMACDSPEKVVEVEMAAGEAAMEKAVAMARKVADLSGKIVEEAVAPLTERAETAAASLTKVFEVK
jgi:hypothetical protein